MKNASPNVDTNWLARAVRVLQPDEVDRMVDILMSCILETFPIDSADEVCEIATVANTLESIMPSGSEGNLRQEQV